LSERAAPERPIGRDATIDAPPADDRLEGLSAFYPGTLCNADAGAAPPIHLFHAPNSVCSQKVRTVLFEAGAPFVSHQLNVGKGDTYLPAYVKLRAEACLAHGFGFAADHHGSTSATDMGCDACVVPTVIDEATGQVLVDSLRICLALDQELGTGLRPSWLGPDIDREIAIVDALPNYPLLAAKMHGVISGGGNAFASAKVDRCNALIATHHDEPLLVAAYTAKRDKELAAHSRLFTPEALASAEQAMHHALASLAERLHPSNEFLFGAQFTLADIFWAIELIRNRDIGFGAWADAHQNLRAYEDRLRARPSIQKAILEWPGAKPQLKPRS
jgi:2,5-dichlorohydroquinone reductive dechlorinase